MNKFTIKKKIIESNLIIVFLKFFPFLILIISTLSFYLIKSDFTAFQQNTHTFIPGLEFQNSKEIDFYTSSILESPKINLINFINFFFSDWYFGIYFFKVFNGKSVWLKLSNLVQYKGAASLTTVS